MKMKVATLTGATKPACGGAGTFKLTIGMTPKLVSTVELSDLPTNTTYFNVSTMKKLVGGVASDPTATELSSIFTTLNVDKVMSFVCTSDMTTGSSSITITSVIAGTVDPWVTPGLDGGAIAGIVIGSVVFVVLVILLIWCCCKKPKTVKKTGESLPLHDNKVLVQTGK